MTAAGGRRDWTPIDLAREAAGFLATKGVADPRLDAELLLAHVLGVRRLDLYLQHDRPLEPPEVDAYRECIRRRARREPLQYIEGVAAFRELSLHVDPRVLVPRPETEMLVALVLERLPADGGRVLEWGVGSGAIAISLAVEAGVPVVGADRSADALDVARVNADRLLDGRGIDLVRADLFASPFRGPFAAIVSNPPYVRASELDGLDEEVREWEPRGALVSGARGTECHEAILRDAVDVLGPGGFVALEVGEESAGEVAGLAGNLGAFSTVERRADLTGRERFVIATRD